MLQNLLNNAGNLVQTNPWLAFVAVFVGGILTASNPCVLAMIPLMIGFVGGMQEGSGWRRSLLFSVIFVLGLSITFAILGVIAATVGGLIGDIGNFWKWVVGAVCLIMGLHLLGVLAFLNLPIVQGLLDRIVLGGGYKAKHKGFIGVFLLGLLFGVVSTPCAAPVLVVLLTYIAAQGSSIIYGALLLLMYAFGHCVLIFVAGTSIGLARGLLESKGLKTSTNVLRKAAGAIIILVGVYFVFLGG